ncbi:MAG: DUF4007 family protein [Methylococcaceae bacterium]|nr:DUF4007 family protein [Methylococcaceae bacterium]
MKLNKDKTAFGRHETFPLRYGWLTKGFEAVKEEPDIFSRPEHAMVGLGVGRNMVNAIQYWLQASRMVDFNEGMAQPSELGEALLGEGGDRYLEDEATLWIIHWLLASNAELATGIYWFFNRFAMTSFDTDEVLRALGEFIEHELQSSRSLSTLKSEVSTLLRLYAPEVGRGDEHLDSPLASLHVVESAGGGHYRSIREMRPFLPPVAVHFALSQRFDDDPQGGPLPMRAILYGDGGWAAPGAVFRLSEEGLMAVLAKVMEGYPNCYELRDTAGLNQIYLGNKPQKPLEVLRNHYREGMAWVA